MAASWYAVKNGVGAVVGYTSDNAQGWGVSLPVGYSYAGPYASQDAAKTAMGDIAAVDPVAALRVKASSAWTVQDVADWLKARG